MVLVLASVRSVIPTSRCITCWHVYLFCESTQYILTQHIWQYRPDHTVQCQVEYKTIIVHRFGVLEAKDIIDSMLN